MGTPAAKASRERMVLEAVVALAGLALLFWAWRCDAHWFERHFQSSRCMRNDKAFRGAIAWRAIGATAGALLVVWVRPRLGRWTEKRPARERWAQVARIALATILALGACELFLRWKEGPLKEMPRPDLPAVNDSDLTSWTLAPSRAMTWQIGGRQVEYAVNADAVRARSVGDQVDHAAPTILFAGESVVFGIGLTYEETFPAIVGRRLGVQAVNASVHGFGGAQAYLRVIEEVLPRFERPLAVVTIVLAEQVERNTLPNRAGVRIGAGGLLEHAGPEPTWASNVRVRRVWNDVFHYNDDAAFDIERAVLLETSRAARARGAAPLFVVTNYEAPCMRVLGDPPWLFDALFAGTDLPRLDVPIDPAWKLSDDPHPDARAHQKLADAVEKALREAKLPGL